MNTLTRIILLIFTVLSATLAHGQSNQTKQEWSENEMASLMKKVELIPIMINGEKDKRINIVIMNRWTSREKEPYNSPEMRDEFLKDINESLIAALTPGNEKAQTAYANYREFFNVYGLWYPDSPEWDKGIDGKVVDALRDTLFLPWKDENSGWVTFLVMPNRDGGGGGAARNLEARVGRALIAGKGIGKMLHEIAHTCMSIGDEYTAGASGTSANPTYTVSTEYERDRIKWRKWIETDTPLPTPYTEEYKDEIGAFEGAQYHLTDYYRSTAQGCIMGAGVFDNTEKMCPICEQRVAMRVNKLVNPIKSFVPANTAIQMTGKTTLHFGIDYIKPIPNTQVVRWILNGKIIASGVDEIDVEFGELAAYELTCTLSDETPFIRPDPPYAKYPEREITWEISNSAPSSNAKELVVNLRTVQDHAVITLEADISGGTPPFSYRWSNGSTNKTLENIGAGIYELQLTDSEFRTAKSQYSIYASNLNREGSEQKAEKRKKATKAFDVDVNITSSAKGKDKGKIEVRAIGGTAPYTFIWKDGKHEFEQGKVYEAENASIDIPAYTAKEYFDASNNKLISFNNSEGAITWTVEVVKSGTYPIEIAYAGVARKGTPMDISVNGKTVEKSLMFYQTRPLFTGWEKASVSAYLNEGENIVCLNSAGRSGANIDYIRVPATYTSIEIQGSKRFNLKPGEYTVLITDQKNNSVEKTIILPEVYPFEIQKLEFESNKPGVISIGNPLPTYTYLWYSENVPLFTAGKYEEAIFEGTEFAPGTAGIYYVSAKNKQTNTESSNRICIAVGEKSKTDIDDMNPSHLDREHIKLWFDSSDLDGDGNKDGAIPERGPLKDWTEKTWKNPGKIFAKYEPDKLNGMGVCTFGNVWVSDLGKKVSGIQTVILVYKESSLTFPGKCIFRELNEYLGASSEPQKRIFDFEKVHEKTQNARVFLNGKKVDPFNTPNPMEFCILTVEFQSVIEDPFTRIEGFWEGDLAEMIFVDRTLTEAERKGIEEHLRKKWFSAIDISF